MIMWNFQTARFSVLATIEPEKAPDLSWADEDTMAKIKSGEYQVFCTFVKVYFDGHEIGDDCLGESVYSDPADFFRAHLGERGAYFPEMVREAIGRARKNLALFKTIKLRHT